MGAVGAFGQPQQLWFSRPAAVRLFGPICSGSIPGQNHQPGFTGAGVSLNASGGPSTHGRAWPP